MKRNDRESPSQPVLKLLFLLFPSLVVKLLVAGFPALSAALRALGLGAFSSKS